MLIYPDHLQIWLDFGHTLLILSPPAVKIIWGIWAFLISNPVAIDVHWLAIFPRGPRGFKSAQGAQIILGISYMMANARLIFVFITFNTSYIFAPAPHIIHACWYFCSFHYEMELVRLSGPLMWFTPECITFLCNSSSNALSQTLQLFA